MSNELYFASKKQGSLFVYYHQSTNEKIITKPFPARIDDKWWEQWDYRPHDLYNISGLSPAQNAVYLALAWRLMQGHKCLAIPLWDRDDAAKESGLSFELVNWEYRRYSKDSTWKLEDSGFVEAHTSPGPIARDGSYTDSWEFQNRNKAGLFGVESWKEFIDIQKSSLVQAFAEVNYFAFKTQDAADNFVRALKSETQPQLKDLLTSDDLFIDLYVGLDMGYPDAVLIKSGQDISLQLNALVNEYNLAIAKFENRMTHIYEMDDFVQALDELAGMNKPLPTGEAN